MTTDDAALEFRDDDDRVAVRLSYDAFDSHVGYVVIEVRAERITCDHAALSIRGDGLEIFLEGLVADWAGWDGTRRWDAMGPELSIEASHHGGIVRLLFIVRQDEEPDAWQLRVPVYVNPGEPLSRLAAAARRAVDAWARAG